MRTSLAGVKQIMLREGVRLSAYLDTRGILTIGCGHTSAAGEPAVYRGMSITMGQALAILARDLAPVEAMLNRVIKVPVTQNEFDACASLALNIGNGGFQGSSILRQINAGNFAAAADDFLMWDEPPELVGRRKGERAQFLRLDGPQTQAQKSAAPALPAPEESPVGSIAWVQGRLNEFGAQPTLVIDGDFGPATEHAVEAFQTKHGLFIDGVPGPKTIAALSAHD